MLIGKEIIADLRKFNESLRQGDDLANRFIAEILRHPEVYATRIAELVVPADS